MGKLPVMSSNYALLVRVTTTTNRTTMDRRNEVLSFSSKESDAPTAAAPFVAFSSSGCLNKSLTMVVIFSITSMTFACVLTKIHWMIFIAGFESSEFSSELSDPLGSAACTTEISKAPSI